MNDLRVALQKMLEQFGSCAQCPADNEALTLGLAALAAKTSTTCVGCCGTPGPGNTPCAVCGATPDSVVDPVDLSEARRLIVQLRGLRDAKQARIDALMLEYCPDEMTSEQMQEWASHQKRTPASLDVPDKGGAERKRALGDVTQAIEALRSKIGDPLIIGVERCETGHAVLDAVATKVADLEQSAPGGVPSGQDRKVQRMTDALQHAIAVMNQAQSVAGYQNMREILAASARRAEQALLDCNESRNQA